MNTKAPGIEDVQGLLSQMGLPQASATPPQAPAQVEHLEPEPAAGDADAGDAHRGDPEPQRGGKRKGKDAGTPGDQVDESADPASTGSSEDPDTADADLNTGREASRTEEGGSRAPDDRPGAPAKKRPARTQKRPTQQTPKQVRTPRSVYIPSDVERVLVMARAAEGRSYTDIVLEAVNAHYKEAADLPDQAPVAQETTGGLFPREVPLPRSKKGLNSIYLTDAETEVLDSVANQVGLKRSDLVSRCLRAALSNRVYTRMDVVLELQDSGRPAATLKERVKAAGAAGVAAPRIPEEREGWVVMPQRWFADIGNELDEAQAHLKVGSWSEVAWAAMELTARA